jgi:type IV pilus assembly protein PilN
MIRINLLPVRASKKREFGRQQIVVGALAVILALACNYLWYSRVDDDSRALDNRISSTRDDIAKLEKTIGEVKSITAEKKALEDKLKILDNLKKGRTGPVKVMDELSSLIPPRVWISEYTEQGGGVSMHGSSVNYEDLSVFSKKLKTSKHFTDVVIRRANQRGDGIVEWEISCHADYAA